MSNRKQNVPTKAQRAAQSKRDKSRQANHTNKPTPGGPRRRTRRSRGGGGGFNATRVGRSIGGYFGKRGAEIGASAGNLFRTITGFGDYKVNSNTLATTVDALPAFGNVNRGTRISHREFLFDVVTSPTPGAYNVEKVPIQPGLLESFPWLSATAENYQQYELHGVVYEFKSNSYDALASTNTASGTVVMATNYNVLEPDFNNKFTMEQTQFTCSSKPSRDLMHPIECARSDSSTVLRYTRPGPVTAGDLRLYDWGNFYIATVGMQGSSTNIGELWVTYDLTLLKPKLNSTVDVYDHWVIDPTSSQAGGPAYLGDVGTDLLTSDSDLGTSLRASAGTNLDTVVFPPGYTGKVMLLYQYYVPSLVNNTLAAPYMFTITGGITGISAFSSGSDISQGAGRSSGNMVYSGYGGTTLTWFLNVVNGGTIQFRGGTNGAGAYSADLFLFALPSNFFTSGLSSSSLLDGRLTDTTPPRVRVPTVSMVAPPVGPLTLDEKRRISQGEPLGSLTMPSALPSSGEMKRLERDVDPLPKSDLVDDDGDYLMTTDEWPSEPVPTNTSTPMLIPPRLTRQCRVGFPAHPRLC